MEDIQVSWDMVQSPSPPAFLTSSGSLTPTDLRLMHMWSTTTWNSLAAGNWSDHVLLLEVPSLAFENPFLLNCMLGIASLHTQHLLPDPRAAEAQTSLYRAKALSGYREALADITWGTRKYEAALINSILVVILCSQDYAVEEGDLLVVNWLVLYQGLSSLISLDQWDALASLSVAAIFRREFEPLKTAAVIPTTLVSMVQGILPLDADFELLEHYCKALDALAMLYAQLQESGLGPALSIRVITWPSWISQEFVIAAQERRPRAIIIMAYYIVFTRLVKDLWWVNGISHREFETAIKLLPPRFLHFVATPMQAMAMTKDEDVVELMLM